MTSEEARQRIAAAARALIGRTDSSLKFVGTNACAFCVNHVLNDVFGHKFFAPTPDGDSPDFVPSLRAGLQRQGFRSFTDSNLALPGDIAVQNGLSVGTKDNEFENHVGIVIEDPEGSGTFITISNSSSHAAFVHRDDLNFDGLGLSKAKMGPSKFYRFKPAGE